MLWWHKGRKRAEKAKRTSREKARNLVKPQHGDTEVALPRLLPLGQQGLRGLLWGGRLLGGGHSAGHWRPEHTQSDSSPTRQPTPRRAHPAFLSLLLLLFHCSYGTSWSNYMQIKNIFFFKTMLKVKIILRVSYRHMFFSRPNQIQLDLNSPNFELLRRYSLLWTQFTSVTCWNLWDL